VDWVEASGKKLTTIYATHGHGDHFFGIGALLDRFPNARAVATRDVVKLMRQQVSPDAVANFWSAYFPGQIPDRLVIADELQGNVIDLKGTTWWSWNSDIPTPTAPHVCTSRQSVWW